MKWAPQSWELGKKSCWNTYAKSWSIVSNSSNRKLNGLLATTSPAYTEHTGMPRNTKSKKAGEYSGAQQGIMHDTVTEEGCRNIRYVSIYLYMHIIHPSTKITNFLHFQSPPAAHFQVFACVYADKLKRYCASDRLWHNLSPGRQTLSQLIRHQKSKLWKIFIIMLL